MRQDLKNLSFQQLVNYLRDIGEPIYRAQQISFWIYQKMIGDCLSMKNVSGKLIEKLNRDFFISEIILKQKLISKDQTQKFLFKLQDDNLIESVLIPHKNRNTLCLSTQVGCKYSCEFCASGKLGFVRNLTQAEILNQIIFIRNELKEERINNIVFMGMGEPLDNYDNVLGSIRIITSKYGFNIGQRKITISTAGVVDAIRKLAKEGIQIELSVSLHSADNNKRNKIMPINRKHPLGKLMPCLREFVKITKRKVTFEYVLLGSFNTSVKDADLLIKTLKYLNCKINLISFNPVTKGMFTAPTKEEVSFFKNYLNKNRLNVTVRQPRGQDIKASCGQLRFYTFAASEVPSETREKPPRQRRGG